QLIPDLTASQVRALAADGTISGGMIPKLETCLMAVERGVEAAVILDGRVPHSMLLEIFTPQGVGTLITKGGAAHRSFEFFMASLGLAIHEFRCARPRCCRQTREGQCQALA